MVKERRIGGPAHEAKLVEILNGYEEQGYKVIKLNGKSPDGIVFKDGKAICIEILPMAYSKKKYCWVSNYTKTGKLRIYENLGFDDIEIIPYKKPK